MSIGICQPAIDNIIASRLAESGPCAARTALERDAAIPWANLGLQCSRCSLIGAGMRLGRIGGDKLRVGVEEVIRRAQDVSAVLAGCFETAAHLGFDLSRVCN